MCLDSNHVLDLIDNSIRLCARKIDLVDDRKDIQIMIQCKIYVRQCLCLDSLCRIHDKNCAVTGCKASGNLIVKIDMSWGIDQVEDIFFPVTRLVYDTDCLGFDRDTTLPLQFHIVKDL